MYRPHLSLDDLLRFVIKPLHLTPASRTLYLLLPAAKVSRLLFMLSCPQSLAGPALRWTRALPFLLSGAHLQLQVAHAHRNGTRGGWGSARRSAGTIAAHEHPIQAAMLAVIIIEAGLMQRGAIIDDQ